MSETDQQLIENELTASQKYPFENPPSTSDYQITVDGAQRTVTMQNHHAISNKVFDDSVFLKAMQQAGL